MMSHLSKYRKQHASEFWFILRVLVDMAYFEESVENAFIVVSVTRKKRHFQPNLK